MARGLTIRRGAAKKIESSEITEDVIEKLRALGHDPLVEMARYAVGDVVGLGLMTRAELEADAEYDLDGNVVLPSGRQRALDLVPTKLRADMAKELAQYIHVKKKPGEQPTGLEVEGVMFYLPENGRESTAQDTVQITDKTDRGDSETN